MKLNECYGGLGKYYNFKRTWQVWRVMFPCMLLGFWLLCWYLPYSQFVSSGSLINKVDSSGTVTRAEALEIAHSYAEHRWEATAANVLHDWDGEQLLVDTPDTGLTYVAPGQWHIGPDNIGIPYKVNGFDTPESFDDGIRQGYAAGDIAEKGGKGSDVNPSTSSMAAVGVDGAGFISRCWKLSRRLDTDQLPGVCRELNSTKELEAGDIMVSGLDEAWLFDHWSNASKTKAIFYTAAGLDAKVVMQEDRVFWLSFRGAKPYRYLRIQD